MRDRVSVPVKVVGGDRWGDLSVFGQNHEICGEVVRQVNDYSFAGGHRVRLYKFRKSVHFRIVDGMVVDISALLPAAPPPRRKPRR
jgi:hypothetical protein